MTRGTGAVAAALACVLLGAAGCAGTGGENGDQPRSASGSAAGNGTGSGLRLLASFYPLQWTAEQVGGGRISVQSLTKPGVEPHDVELSPRMVAEIAEADLVVYLEGFQPAVDAAVRTAAKDRGFDVSKAADLIPVEAAPSAERQGPADAGSPDPHFWLDPIRLAAVADALAARLAAFDPSRAEEYRRNAAVLVTRLRALHEDFRTGLANCASRYLVTGHQAFGYLAQRYRLTQVGISGLTPQDEPKPADLAKVSDFVRTHQVRTIYYEALVSPSVARTVAAETGAASALLDPIEGLTQESRGTDYLQVMRSNLATLRSGQRCR